MHKAIIILCFFILFGCNHPESDNFNRDNSTTSFSKLNTNSHTKSNIPSPYDRTLYKVVGVKDGDTIELLIHNYTLIVRLAHIDCPEKKQPFGQKAKQFVSDFCFNKNVSLIHNNKFDRNHRLIAEVILEDGKNLNKLLVENGLAWHYKKYSKVEEYTNLEIRAKQINKGLWGDLNPIAPWDWRN